MENNTLVAGKDQALRGREMQLDPHGIATIRVMRTIQK